MEDPPRISLVKDLLRIRTRGQPTLLRTIPSYNIIISVLMFLHRRMQPIMALLADPDSDILLIINMMQGNLRNR
ncbi:MAG: hypothetical protein H6P94_70 [Thermoplasmatales archaeon]|nr:hypothetical protein [Thermoplasmatales archaeon]